jgi:hypothetical protein
MGNRRNPLEAYEALLEGAGNILATSERETLRAWLRTGLGKRRPDPRTLELLERHGLSAGYVIDHLLPTESFGDVLKKAVLHGLPLPTARKVHALEVPEDQREVLTSFLHPSADGLSNASRAKNVEEAVLTVRSRNEFGGLISTGNRLPPAESPEKAQVWRTNVLIYPALKRSALEREALHPSVATAVIGRYSNPGQLVVDPMAGTGVFAQAAHRLGRWSFSSDIAPDGSQPYVQKLAISELSETIGHGIANLLIMHPPTFRSWSAHDPGQVERTESGYENFLNEVFLECESVLAIGGHLVAITQPARDKQGRVVADLLSAIVRAMETPFDGTHRHHVAVSITMDEDWHIFVGQRRA